MAHKVSALTLKNVSGTRLFFPPLNKHVEEDGLVDVLAVCEGDTALAQTMVAPYRKASNWQIFEILAGPIPSPEGELQNTLPLEVAPSELQEAPVAKKAAKKLPRPKLAQTHQLEPETHHDQEAKSD